MSTILTGSKLKKWQNGGEFKVCINTTKNQEIEQLEKLKEFHTNRGKNDN